MARDYSDSNNIVARINLPNMYYQNNEKLEIYAAAQTGLMQNEINPEKIRKYAEFIDYYVDLTETEIEYFREQYLDKGEMMGLTQIYFQQGIEKGIEQGIEQGLEQGVEEGLQQGRHQESVVLITRLLRRKFGLKPELDNILQQLEALTTETLEDLAEALFEIHDVEQIMQWIALRK